MLPDCVYAPNQPAFVRPCAPTPTHTLYLSNLDDQSFLRFTIKYLYVFRHAVAADDLKSALSRTLVEYYPLAGRLRRCRGGDGKLEIECNGNGAVFAEAEIDLTAEKFLEFASKPNKALKKLLYSVDGAGFLEIPPLVIQVTNLRCGGMILCTAINHCFCDGIGTSQFLHAWAHMTRYPSATCLPIQPFHSRHVLTPRSPPQVTCSHHGLTNVDPNSGDSNTTYRFLQSQPLVPSSIIFSTPQIHQLKQQCQPSLKCSTFEVLACHTWRCWVKSLGLPPAVTVKLLFSVNFRNKLHEPLPAGYYGNGFVLACAEAQVKELVAAPGLHDGVKLVQQAKSTVNDECVRSMVDMMEDDKDTRVDQSTSLVISQWSRLGLQEVDFGLGKPLHMGPLASSIYCLFLPVAGDFDAVRVLMSMPEGVVDRFEFYMRDFAGVLEHADGMNQYGVDSLIKMVHV